MHYWITIVALLLAMPAFGQSGSGVTVTGASFGSAGGGGGTFADTTCIDGTSCYCDCLTASGTHGTYANATCQTAGYSRWGTSTIIMCEDFDDPDLNDGTGVGWLAAMGGTGGFDTFGCPDYEEGLDANDCYNIVQNGSGSANCDTNAGNTTTSCALGNGGLGQKYDPGEQHSKHGYKTFGGTYYTTGMTIVLKYTANFNNNTASFKNDEYSLGLDLTRGMPLGQNNSIGCDSNWTHRYNGCGNENHLSCVYDDQLWPTRIFTLPYSASSVGASLVEHVTGNGIVTTGLSSSEWGYSPCSASFPGGWNWPKDEWACIETKVSDVGIEASTRVEIWWTSESQARTKVMDVQNIDLTLNGTESQGSSEFSSGVDRYVWNNYFRGPADNGYQGATRAYRYQENITVTNGDPIPCSIAMAPIIGS